MSRDRKQKNLISYILIQCILLATFGQTVEAARPLNELREEYVLQHYRFDGYNRKLKIFKHHFPYASVEGGDQRVKMAQQEFELQIHQSESRLQALKDEMRSYFASAPSHESVGDLDAEKALDEYLAELVREAVEASLDHEVVQSMSDTYDRILHHRQSLDWKNKFVESVNAMINQITAQERYKELLCQSGVAASPLAAERYIADHEAQWRESWQTSVGPSLPKFRLKSSREFMASRRLESIPLESIPEEGSDLEPSAEARPVGTATLQSAARSLVRAVARRSLQISPAP